MNVSSQNRKNIYLSLKEIVHNVIKHAKASLMELNISISDIFFSILLKDNGVGFDPAKVKPNAMGLENVKFRIKKLSGTATITHLDGTEILIKIPLKEISGELGEP